MGPPSRSIIVLYPYKWPFHWSETTLRFLGPHVPPLIAAFVGPTLQLLRVFFFSDGDVSFQMAGILTQ